MRIILEPLDKDFDFYNDNDAYANFQNALGMDENFDLMDSIIYAMDYGELKDEKIEDRHNNIKITIEP